MSKFLSRRFVLGVLSLISLLGLPLLFAALPAAAVPFAQQMIPYVFGIVLAAIAGISAEDGIKAWTEGKAGSVEDAVRVVTGEVLDNVFNKQPAALVPVGDGPKG